MAFDTHAEIASRIRRTEGMQEIVVRWPSDQEWIEYRKAVPIKLHHLGRGMSEGEADSSAADLKLYDKIRVGNSPDLTPEEAEKMIGDVSRCDIMDVLMSTDDATVEMVICGGFRVRHTLRIPTTAETMQFKRARSRALQLPHGRQLLRTNIQAGGELWTKCQKGAEGYANGSVPVLHQDAAVLAVINACDNEAEALKDEDF